MMVFELKLEAETAITSTLAKKLSKFLNFCKSAKTKNMIYVLVPKNGIFTTHKNSEEQSKPEKQSKPEEQSKSEEQSKPEKQSKPEEKLRNLTVQLGGDLYAFSPEAMQSFCGFFGQLIPHVGEKQKQVFLIF